MICRVQTGVINILRKAAIFTNISWRHCKIKGHLRGTIHLQNSSSSNSSTKHFFLQDFAHWIYIVLKNLVSGFSPPTLQFQVESSPWIAGEVVSRCPTSFTDYDVLLEVTASPSCWNIVRTECTDEELLQVMKLQSDRKSVV